jgi:hypothetical protein
LTEGEELTTVLPDHAKLYVHVAGTQKFVGDGSNCEYAPISQCDIAASNGVVHGIDEMLLPTATVCPDSLIWAGQRDSLIGYNRVRCNGKALNITSLLAMNQTKPVGLSVDRQYEETKYVMWSNDQNYQPYDSWIAVKNVQDNTTQLIFPSKLYDPQGLVIDDVYPNPHVYFTEHLGNRVSRASPLIPAPGDHLSRDPVIAFNTSLYPADVKVDMKEGLVFVAVENGPNDPGCCGFIMSMNISDAPIVPNPTTHQLENVRILKDGLAHPYGMCIDQTNQHLFYIVGGHGGYIGCYAYGSTPCMKEKVYDTLEYPYMCAVEALYAEYGGPSLLAYTTASIPGEVYLGDTNGSAVTLIQENIKAPMGLSFACLGEQPNITNPAFLASIGM